MTDLELTNFLGLIEEKENGLYEAQSGYSDLHSEYLGEVSRYGDAWVGAQLQLHRCRKALDKDLAELQELRAKLPPVHTCEPPAVVEEECPF
jgi:hypothetical protein